MPRSVDKVQIISFTNVIIFHLDRVALDGDAPLPFKVHIVENLILVFPFRDCVCLFKKAVSQGAFTVVNMGYNAEITDTVH